MYEIYAARLSRFNKSLEKRAIGMAIIVDSDALLYFLGRLEFADLSLRQPRILIIGPGSDPILFLPACELDLAGPSIWIADLRPLDNPDAWWKPIVAAAFGRRVESVGVEIDAMPSWVWGGVKHAVAHRVLVDVGPILSWHRMVKSSDELEVFKQAGAVAVTMMEKARRVLAKDVAEFEVALAATATGAKAAAELFNGKTYLSPAIQIQAARVQSGRKISGLDRPATSRKLQAGDRIRICLCGISLVNGYKMGFDREFLLGRKGMDKNYSIATKAQSAALAVIRPGMTCEEVYSVSEQVYREERVAVPSQIGHSIGLSFQEEPRLRPGQKTRIEAGMVFAIGGRVIDHTGLNGARIMDSVIVTETGSQLITSYTNSTAVETGA